MAFRGGTAMTISVIVPMYRGKKYLHNILEQVDRCSKSVQNSNIELILYNDYPDERIDVVETGYNFEIKVINPGFNSGIHGARVNALTYAIGEYVLFLDQDDKIESTYFVSQMKCIGDADAVVCRAIHNNRFHYTNSHVFENVISKEFMLNNWCPIVSPGQVLIKTSSIPRIWKEDIMTINGCDDYFLWLLMVSENKEFALNQEVLFEHVVTDINASHDTNKMMDSEMEMITLLKKNKVFSGEDKDALESLPLSLRRIHIKELDNYKKAYLFLQQWHNQMNKGKNPFSFFEKNNIKKIAIYGAGDLGRNLQLLLISGGIDVKCFIDQNAEYIISDIPVCKKEDIPKEIEGVILTIDVPGLKRELEHLMGNIVYDIHDLLK